MTPAKRNRKTSEFDAQFSRLPPQIQAIASEAFQTFLVNPKHPSLRLHQLKETHRSKHVPNSFSVSITLKYRAIFVVHNNENIWYWISTHTEYGHFTGLNR